MLRAHLHLAASVVRDAPLRRLTAGHIASYSATWVYALAIAAAAYSHGGATAAGVLYASRILPGALFASFAGTLTANIPRRRVLVTASLARAGIAGATCLALVLHAPLPILVLVSALITLTSAVARPGHQAALPMLVDGERLVAANALTNLLENVSMLASPALGAAMLLIAGPRVTLVVVATAFLAAALVEMRLPRLDAIHRSDCESSSRGMLAGWREAFAIREMRLVLALTVVTLPLFGAMNVIVLAIGADRFGQPAAGGLLLASFGLGGVLGAVPALAIVNRSPWLALCGGGALLGAAFAAGAASPVVSAACVGFAVAGAGSTVTEIAAETITQRLFSGDALVRVLGITFSVAWTTMAIGGLIAPLLIAAAGVVDAAVLIGGAALAAALAVGLLLRRADASARAGSLRTPAFARPDA